MSINIIVIAILSAGAVLALIRMIFQNPSTKAVVLDVLTTLVTAVIVILALISGSSFLLDIALVYAILSFAAVLVVGRYLERGI